MSTFTITPQSAWSLSLKSLLVRHPFVSYVVLAFAGTWLLNLPLILGQDGLGILPYQMPFGLYALIFLAGSFAGPALAALLGTATLAGKAGVRHFLRRYLQWRVGWRWYLLILVGYPLFFLGLVSLGVGGAPWQALRQQWSTLFTFYLPALLIFPAIINWGEEAGWRGFAQTHIQATYGAGGKSTHRFFTRGLAFARLSVGGGASGNGAARPLALCPQHARHHVDHSGVDVGL